MIILVFIASTSCYASEDWAFIAESNEDMTMQMEMSSIETINNSVTRVLVRFVRDAKIPNIYSNASIVDFDCEKSRYKILQSTTTQYSNVSVETVPVPVYKGIKKGSLWDLARSKVCQVPK